MAPGEAPLAKVLRGWRAAWEQEHPPTGGPARPWPQGPARSVVRALVAATGRAGDAADLLDRAASEWVAARLGVGDLVRSCPVLRSLIDTANAEVLQDALDLLVQHAARRALQAAEAAACHDPLTGLGNRRALLQTASLLLARARRDSLPITVAVADLDRLKEVNDRAGHAAGDRLLRCFAARLRSALRASEQAFRVGGDEFVILFPATTPDGARAAFDRATADGPSCTVGLAVVPAEATDLEAALVLADQRLCEAKAARDRPPDPSAGPWAFA